MNQFMMGLLLILGIGCWWLYSENQTLKANNIKLEYAVEEQKQTIETIREQYEKQGNALMNMTRENAAIEQEKAEYLAIFARHNLDNLALRKPTLSRTWKERALPSPKRYWNFKHDLGPTAVGPGLGQEWFQKKAGSLWVLGSGERVLSRHLPVAQSFTHR